jgi:hypothetical protein
MFATWLNPTCRWLEDAEHLAEGKAALYFGDSAFDDLTGQPAIHHHHHTVMPTYRLARCRKINNR